MRYQAKEEILRAMDKKNQKGLFQLIIPKIFWNSILVIWLNIYKSIERIMKKEKTKV